MVELIPHPTSPGLKTLRFCAATQYKRDPAAKRLLNLVFVAAATRIRKDDGSCYQPNSIARMTRQLFTCLKELGSMFTSQDFVGMKGSFHAYWTKTFKEAMEEQPDLGRTPFRAAVEHRDEFKMRHMADPPYNPDDYDDNMILTMWKVSLSLQFVSFL